MTIRTLVCYKINIYYVKIILKEPDSMYNLLYVKSYYSLLSSLLSIDDIINYNLAMKKDNAIICDNNMYGVMEFIKKCESNNLKPVIGLEVTLNNYKILIYARNYNGYLNMIKICTYQNDGSLNIDNLLGKFIIISFL